MAIGPAVSVFEHHATKERERERSYVAFALYDLGVAKSQLATPEQLAEATTMAHEELAPKIIGGQEFGYTTARLAWEWYDYTAACAQDQRTELSDRLQEGDDTPIFDHDEETGLTLHDRLYLNEVEQPAVMRLLNTPTKSRFIYNLFAKLAQEREAQGNGNQSDPFEIEHPAGIGATLNLLDGHINAANPRNQQGYIDMAQPIHAITTHGLDKYLLGRAGHIDSTRYEANVFGASSTSGTELATFTHGYTFLESEHGITVSTRALGYNNISFTRVASLTLGCALDTRRTPPVIRRPPWKPIGE